MSKVALIFALVVLISSVTAIPQYLPENRASTMLKGFLSKFPFPPNNPSLRRSGSELVMTSQVEKNGVVQGEVITMDKDGKVQHLHFK